MSSAPLRRRLEREPYSFAFFQLMRLLERMSPERKPVGRYDAPSEEVARLGAHASMAFPASEVQSLEFLPEGPPRMTVNFFGLQGPSGVMPLFYTALMRERLRARDNTLRDFFDLINHRMLSLFYQGWERYRLTVPYERGERDKIHGNLLDMVGLGTPGLAGQQAIPDEVLVFYAGLFTQRPRSAQALQQILADYFDVDTRVEQLTGSWFGIEDETQCRLGARPGPSRSLGGGAMVGDEIYDHQSVVRIRIGPLTLKRYREFLPDGSAHAPLKALIRFFSGDEYDFEVQLVLRKEEAPDFRLRWDGEEAPSLGWVSWMIPAALPEDPGHTVLRLRSRGWKK